MTTTKPLSRQLNKAWGVIVLIALAFVLVPFTAERPETGTTLIYAILVSAFLVAQLVGFVMSHTYYSDGVEEIKFELLKNEEAEWHR